MKNMIEREYSELCAAYAEAKHSISNRGDVDKAMYLLSGILTPRWIDAVYARAHRASEALGRKANGLDKDMIEFLVIRESISRLPLFPTVILKDRWYEKYHNFQMQEP